MQSEYERYTTLALKNMHHYASWRVNQLDVQKNVLNHMAKDGGELEELMNYATRIVRTEKNQKKYNRKKEDIEFELIKREMRDDEQESS
ncbi:hypothetical protein JXI42_07090 [bacterium]|nr:hypothetical protein [bacterium]